MSGDPTRAGDSGGGSDSRGGPGSGSTLSEAQLAAAVTAYFSAMDALDVEATVALFAEDGELECVTDGRHPRGHAELRAFFHGVVDGSHGMEHPVTWQAIDAARGAVATIQDYRDVRDTGAVYDERTCNFFRIAPDGRIQSIRFWRGKAS